MAWTKIFRIGLMAAAILVMVDSMGSEVEATCNPCALSYRIYGVVTYPDGDPAPDGTIVYAVCDINSNDDCYGHSEQCEVDGGNGDYSIFPGCSTLDPAGRYRVWAVYRYQNGECKFWSDEFEVVYFESDVRQDLVLSNGPVCE